MEDGKVIDAKDCIAFPEPKKPLLNRFWDGLCSFVCAIILLLGIGYSSYHLSNFVSWLLNINSVAVFFIVYLLIVGMMIHGWNVIKNKPPEKDYPTLYDR